MASKSKPLAFNQMADVIDRLGITAREARDITTAFSSIVASRGSEASRKDLVKQVKEVGIAAKKGEVGTTAGKVKEGKFKTGTARNYPKTFNVIGRKEKKPASIKKIKEF